MRVALCPKENGILEFWNLKVKGAPRNPLVHAQLWSESLLCKTKSKLGFPMRNTENGKTCASPSGSPRACGLNVEYVQWPMEIRQRYRLHGAGSSPVAAISCWTVRSLRKEAYLFYSQMCHAHNMCSIYIACGMNQGKGTEVGSEQEQV